VEFAGAADDEHGAGGRSGVRRQRCGRHLLNQANNEVDRQFVTRVDYS
jgi:hypothetical protein